MMNSKQRIVGFINILLCLIFTYIIKLLIIDQPVTLETASLLKLESKELSAYITSFFLGNLCSLFISYLIGAWIADNSKNSWNGLNSNIVSKLLCYIALGTFLIGLMLGIVQRLTEMAN